ncbi:MAG: hemolysin III family protein [Bdellovibrionales bacterium]|nr:hemolysin III family protein [Bdellovibrionales bacterium]
MNIIAIPGFSEPFSCWSHLLAAVSAAGGFYFLARKGRGNFARLWALGLFSFSLIFLFSMSGVYHLLEPGGTPRAVLQRLDHAGIWVLIAGTFTPIHTILFRGAWRWGILLLVWGVAITGLVLEVVFFSAIPEWVSLGFYLGLGWVGVLTAWRFVRQFGEKSFHLLWVGGVFYSLGAVMEFLRWPVVIEGIMGPHEVFHLFVMAGALTHWWFVYSWSDHPVGNALVFQVVGFSGQFYRARALGENLRLEAESLEVLKDLIKRHTRARFHHSMTPTIHLKFFEEEVLRIDDDLSRLP